MRIVLETVLIGEARQGPQPSLEQCEQSIRSAIRSVDWPPDSGSFTVLVPRNGKPHANGVGPIKKKFVDALSKDDWLLEKEIRAPGRAVIGRLDAVHALPGSSFSVRGRIIDLKEGALAAVEWETGNISSSHRSLNRLSLGIMQGTISLGVLVIPTRALYLHLTDRIGNYEELENYFSVWRALPSQQGRLEVIAIEHDATSSDEQRVPRIVKGTDGRALQ